VSDVGRNLGKVILRLEVGSDYLQFEGDVFGWQAVYALEALPASCGYAELSVEDREHAVQQLFGVMGDGLVGPKVECHVLEPGEGAPRDADGIPDGTGRPGVGDGGNNASGSSLERRPNLILGDRGRDSRGSKGAG